MHFAAQCDCALCTVVHVVLWFIVFFSLKLPKLIILSKNSFYDGLVVVLCSIATDVVLCGGDNLLSVKYQLLLDLLGLYTSSQINVSYHVINTPLLICCCLCCQCQHSSQCNIGCPAMAMINLKDVDGVCVCVVYLLQPVIQPLISTNCL